MSTYDSTGLSMDRYIDILENMVERAKEWKGESIDTDEQSALGHILRQLAYQLDDVNEKIQAVYDATSISNNSGTHLANMLELIGMSMQSAAKSTVTLTCVASKACTIPKGTLVRTGANVYFEVDEDLVFTSAGSGTVGATCTEFGPYSAGPTGVSIIVNAINGWISVTNEASVIPGRNRETSAEAKRRHAIAVSTSGERDAASIFEAVSSVDGVSAVRVTEDYTSDTPVSVYVIGGSDEGIANAIDDHLTVGIGTAGTTDVDIYNTTIRQSKTISFTRGTYVNAYVSISLGVNAALYPADGENRIKEAIVEMVEALPLGEGLVYLSLPSAIYTVPGIVVHAISIGFHPLFMSTGDLDVGDYQKIAVEPGNIEVTYV